MYFKFMLVFLLCFAAGLFAQGVERGEDISNTNGNYFLVSDADSVYWSGDSLYIWGSDTAFIFINTRKTLGMITYKGIAEAALSDSFIVYFDMAKCTGIHYDSLDSYHTESFVAMDTATCDTSAKVGFYFYPLQSTTFQDYNHTLYYILRIYGTAAYKGRLYIMEERINAY
jgi:hypothetical protein